VVHFNPPQVVYYVRFLHVNNYITMRINGPSFSVKAIFL